MPSIHLLPDHLASQIAAGEVVERPASVVKELLENALDAGAQEVAIDLEAGGRRLVRVADDGRGMGREDTLLAFDRHATSKISSFEDLERVGTFGFRGEALAAIAAVARVELVSAERPGEGHRVAIEGGRVRASEPAARARGTTLSVASLFFNVPARRKFLKSTETELRRAAEVVQGYALACPGVRLTVRSEGRLLLATPAATAGGEQGLRERIGQLFGGALAAELVAIENRGVSAGSPGTASFGGFVGRPVTTRGRRTFVFVNGRLVRDRAVLATFYRAVREEWKSDEFPALFLRLDLPPEEVDVNVHPQKAEVRFRDSGVLDRLHAALRDALARGRGEEPAPLRVRDGAPPVVAWEGLGGPLSAAEAASSVLIAPGGEPPAPLAADLVREPASLGGAWTARISEATFAAPGGAPVPLSGRTGERPLRVLGQYKGTLLLLEAPESLLLVDQHVAHERILYERLRRALLAARPASQRLLEPLLLELGPVERLRITALAAGLEELGFELAELSGGALGLTAVPAALGLAAAERTLLHLAGEEAGSGGEGAAGLRRRLLESWAASAACRAAVKMHHPLTLAEMQALVSELLAAEHPWACPHGRPVVLELTDGDLERRFGRR